ncbi:NADH-quinone oxidoreductase subunit L [Dehalococcoidales bacterium]|nr:NADH-quinone oxidoreductase subunit L [Dehalococcoidales bacterium]
MIPYQLVWLIFLLPVFSFIIISFILRPFFKHQPKLSGYTTIASLLGSFGLSIWALISVLAIPERELLIPDISWVVIEGEITIHLGLIVDSLTVVMLIVITVVSLMVQIYSLGYMRGDPGYHRYFAFMSLFTASMLGLVMADNLLLLFVFWELVGLCSYLLIGFWFHRPAAAAAAKKAFIITRLGDFGFLVAILALFLHTGTFDIAEINRLAITGALAGATLTWVAIGIFAGAVGKSAQFPLHTWLPDAMEGPTPVSALIHAATMVAAGVFLVARMYPLFVHAEALTIVAIIGGVTALFAATMGLVMTDIKRVLAYSTVSQLGYMMLGLGVGGVAIGIIHLFNHAFFKALLFLGAGSVNHATGTFDIREMGGLRRVMPWTYITFVIASLSIAGIWPLSGFWSKEKILLYSLDQPILFCLAMLTAFLTAFYMFRVVFLTFGGEYRGGGSHHHVSQPHESPLVMVMPMVFLAILAVVSGWLDVTKHFSQFLGYPGETHSFIYGFFGILAHPLSWASLIVAGLGILLAYAMYSAKWLSAERITTIFSPLHTLFSRKYWFDELYEGVFVKKALVSGFFAGLEQFDTYGVDGTVNRVANATIAGGRAIRRVHTGQLQLYGLFIGIGILAIILCLYFFG